MLLVSLKLLVIQFSWQTDCLLNEIIQLRLPKDELAVHELVINIIISNKSHFGCLIENVTGVWISNSNISINSSVQCHGLVRHWQILDPNGKIFTMQHRFTKAKPNSNTELWISFSQIIDLTINYYFVLASDLRDYVFTKDSQSYDEIGKLFGNGSAILLNSSVWN